MSINYLYLLHFAKHIVFGMRILYNENYITPTGKKNIKFDSSCIAELFCPESEKKCEVLNGISCSLLILAFSFFPFIYLLNILYLTYFS